MYICIYILVYIYYILQYTVCMIMIERFKLSVSLYRTYACVAVIRCRTNICESLDLIKPGHCHCRPISTS